MSPYLNFPKAIVSFMLYCHITFGLSWDLVACVLFCGVVGMKPGLSIPVHAQFRIHVRPSYRRSHVKLTEHSGPHIFLTGFLDSSRNVDII